MSLLAKLHELRTASEQARFRIETVGRVGVKLGMHRTLTPRGALVLLRGLVKGRTTPSLILRFQGANSPDRVALIQGSVPGEKSGQRGSADPRTFTYRALDEQIDRVGLALARRGVGRGSSVLLLLKNRVEFIVAQNAVGRIGAAAVPASFRSTVPELEYLAGHCRARAIFFDADIADMITQAAPRLADVPRDNFFSVGGATPGFASWEDLVAEIQGTAPDASDAGALMMYTSGTTGRPKGAVRSFNRSVVPGIFAFIGETPMALEEPHLVVCPLYHATANAFANLTFLLGGTVVVMGDFDAERFLRLVERHRIASAALVPTMLHRVVELGRSVVRGFDLSSLKALFSGGAPLDGTLAVAAMDLLGDVVFNFYGATETGLVTLATPADQRAAPTTIGRPIPGVEVRLIDEDGKDCPTGQVGELYARSQLLSDGYLADPDATQKSMLDSYFSVGDLARKDERGLYFIEGRKRDMIISGGVNVYPAEIEGVLHQHPAVVEAAVVGAADREWGERVRAFVVRRPSSELDGKSLEAHCKARLSGPKVPRDFVFLESLPRNPTGKVKKDELRRMEGV